jgi:hypothetical protein
MRFMRAKIYRHKSVIYTKMIIISELDSAQARFNAANLAFQICQDSEEESGQPMPPAVVSEYRESAKELLALEKLEIAKEAAK